MTPRVNFVTLGVQDMPAMRGFYERLGLTASSASNVVRARAIATAAVWAVTVGAVGFGLLPLSDASSRRCRFGSR